MKLNKGFFLLEALIFLLVMITIFHLYFQFQTLYYRYHRQISTIQEEMIE